MDTIHAEARTAATLDAAQPTPAGIMQMGTGFWPSKILLTAIEFELFTHLAVNGAMKASEIKALLKLNCTDRHLYDFLDVLASFNFLQRDGLLNTAMYANGVDTEVFLDKAKPSYIGGILEMLNDRLYGFWGNLGDGLRTGKPQNETKNCGEPFFAKIYADPLLLKGFVNAMSGMQVGNFMLLGQQFDFSKYKTLVDVGGSGGILSVMVAKHQPHMSCTSWDLPPVQPIAAGTIRKEGLTDRVKATSGDFMIEALPKADVITMGNILHDWNEEDKLMLMKKAYDALPDGGAFIAVESVIDNERRANPFGMMMSLNMLIETEGGFDYTFDDFNKWAKQVGFKSTSLMRLTGPTSAAVAYK